MNMHRHEARKLALELGAVQEGIFYTHNWHGRELCTIHYFNDEGTEVMYWSRWMESAHVFETPRVWADQFKETLSMHDMNVAA